MIDQLSQMEGRDDEYSYVNTMERQDVNRRLKMLFKPDEQAGDKGTDIDEAGILKEDYETVNEGDTTDTTSGVDDDALLSRTKPKSAQAAE